MLVTAVEPRKKSFSAVYIDGEFAFKLDTETLIEEKIYAGVEIDDERLHKIVIKSDTKRAKEKALWLLSFRDRSKKELVDKLAENFDLQCSEAAVDRMEELGLVNDENYARRYASDLLNIKHMSKRNVKYKLMQKGIDRDLCDEILEEFEVDNIEQITIIIKKKYLRYLDDEKGLKKTYAALTRMGYGYSDIKSAIIYVCENED